MLRTVKKIPLILLILLGAISIAVAEPTYDEEGDLVLPNSRLSSGKIDSIGPVDKDGNGYMIIDDGKYMVNDQTVFRNIRGNITVFVNFMKGMRVKFYALENMITKIMETTAAADDDVDEKMDISPNQAPDAEGLRLEDGVWVN